MEFVMDADFVMSWKAPAPGREKKGLEFVVELEKRWDNYAARGQCTAPDVFFLPNGPGTFTVKGERGVLEDLAASEELQELFAKGSLLFQDWKCRMAETGTRSNTSPACENSVGSSLRPVSQV
jgi:hypothetical protein